MGLVSIHGALGMRSELQRSDLGLGFRILGDWACWSPLHRVSSSVVGLEVSDWAF